MAKAEIQPAHAAATKASGPLSKSAESSVAVPEDLSTSDESGPSSSVNSKADDNTASPPKVIEPRQGRRKMETLEERGRTPASLYVTLATTFMLQGCSGMYKLDTLKQWLNALADSTKISKDIMEYEKELMRSIFTGEFRSPMEYLWASIWTALVGSILWVLIGKPLKAGLWTGQRATKHKMHRYMGLCFLIQYTLSWVHFLTYTDADDFSFIPHTVAMNGVVQGYSAYFSFKVLPELKDSGFYSDKGVMSRNFLHENICFNLFCIWGAVYYHTGCREVLQSNWGGKLMELIFCFYPYVMIRPFFPTTRFSDAGSRENSRSPTHQKFYELGVTLVKFFYLWAKYFLGFHFNWLIYLGLTTKDDMRFIQGVHLLNTGTVAIAMFLHTLRFKKILPPKFAFSFYVVQIYLTFSALPYAIQTLFGHPKLALLTFTGILTNMTRSRPMHAAWCFTAMLIVLYADIAW